MVRALLAFVIASGLTVIMQANAEKKRIDGIGMSGTAFMIPYQLGVARTFIDYGMFEKYVTAGASGGALSGSLGCSGMSFTSFKKSIFAAVTTCANDANMCVGTLGEKLSNAISATLPSGQSYANCNGRLYIQTTIGTVPQDPTSSECFCTQTDKNRGKLVRHFKSRSDFVSILKTTTYLSKIVAPECTRSFRKFDETCDGGYSDNLPCPPQAIGEGKFCLKASVYPKFMWSSKTNTTGPADIYPGVRGDDTLPFQDRDLWATATHNPKTIDTYKDEIYQAGRLDAKFWLDENGFKRRNY